VLLQGLQNFMREFLVSYKYHTDVLQANTSHSFTSVILLCGGFFFFRRAEEAQINIF
jgi:hypothetical protein